MPAETRQTQPLRDRLAIAALITVVNAWIGIAHVIPDTRRRSFSRRLPTRLSTQLAAGGFATDALGRHERVDRILTTVLFTDIVASTERVVATGDRHWRAVLDAHDEAVRDQLVRFGGREIKTTGDGFLASFDGPARAIRCAQAITSTTGNLGIELRAGLHTGECEVRGDDLAGLAVHIAARVGALAGPREVLVSSTVKELVAGSGIAFCERGEYELKGVPGPATLRCRALKLNRRRRGSTALLRRRRGPRSRYRGE